MQAADGSGAKRCSIETAEVVRPFEAPQYIVNGRRHHPVAHVVCDLRAVGYPAMKWWIHKVGARATLCFDLLHRRTRDWGEAVVAAGLRLLQVECRQVLKMRRGPFSNSSNHWVLVQAAEEMYKVTGAHANVPCTILYPAISQEMPMSGAELGSGVHPESVWEAMRLVLRKQGMGSNTNSSRWWDFEESSSIVLAHRAGNFCVVLGCDLAPVAEVFRRQPFERPAHAGQPGRR